MNRWLLLKDVILTGTGIIMVLSQVYEAINGLDPSALLVGAGLALTVPSIADHVRALLPGTDSPSSSSSQPHGSGHSSSSESTSAVAEHGE